MSKFAVTGIARDATGYPVRLLKTKTKGCVSGKVQVEDRVMEGNFQERDLKYIPESEYKQLVTKQRRIGGGKKSYEARKRKTKKQTPKRSGIGDKKD